jgi:lysozyme
MNLSTVVKHFEGLRLTAYLCPAGVWTIGYGSTGPDIKLGVVWTVEQSEARLLVDATRAMQTTLRLCPQLMASESRALAIADFTYNLGATRLAGSTLRRRIRDEDWKAAGDELPKWVRGGTRVLPGLVRRRDYERQLFLGAAA